MRWRGDGNRQATLHGDATLEAHQLHGDLALIVIHGDDTVVMPVFGTHENRICREGAIHRNAA